MYGKIYEIVAGKSTPIEELLLVQRNRAYALEEMQYLTEQQFQRMFRLNRKAFSVCAKFHNLCIDFEVTKPPMFGDEGGHIEVMPEDEEDEDDGVPVLNA